MKNVSLNPRRVFLIGLALAALLAGAFALSSSVVTQSSRADVNDNQTTCRGFVQAAAADPLNPDLTQVQYRIRCNQAISGYSLFISAHQVQAIETEAFPQFADGSPVPTDSFSCNGDLPGNGVNCVGKYSDLSGIITGTFAIDAPLCKAGSRIEPILTVVKAPGSGSNPVAISGPFSLHHPAGCEGVKNKPGTKLLMPKDTDEGPEVGAPVADGPAVEEPILAASAKKHKSRK